MGVLGNEEADKLAKQAAAELLPGRHLVLCRDLIPSICKSISDAWQNQWNNMGMNKLKEVKSKVSPRKYGKMPRRCETAVCRLRIGHTRLTHGVLMSRDPQVFAMIGSFDRETLVD